MSKRTATTELNHDNWCEEEEPETAGVFKKASVDDLKKRQFRTARRRGVGSGDPAEDAPNGEKSVFAGFSGFKKTEPASSKALFSFLSAAPNGNNTQPDTASSTTSSALKPSFTLSDSNDKKPLNGVDAASDASAKSSDKEYFRRLKGLNESVSKWISTHVASNPLIILTPVFRDYEKHLANIQNKDDSKASVSTPSSEADKPLSDTFKKDSSAEKGSNDASTTSSDDKKPLSAFGSTASSAATATFSFGSFASSSATATSQSTSGTSGASSFCFGSPTSSNTANPTFSFGANSTSPSAGFSFGAGKPFTFSNVASTNTTEDKKDDNEDADEDTPPKPDHKPVNEDGATYSKRCKVFFKKDNAYSDRGIGNLFLKPVAGGKTQLIVRADTSLGNVLLNFIVGPSLPIQRIGTNNVAVVCIPTPDSQPPPVTVLLRVKTSDDADELFKTLEKHKNEA